MKINTICFIILLFALVGIASAADHNNNETLHTINQPDNGKLEVKLNDTIMSKSVADEAKLGATSKNTVSASSKSSSKQKVILTAPSVKMYYGDGSKFKITLKDNKKKVIKNAKVKIEINGKTYTKTTNSNGIASMGLKFESGSYKVTATYDGSGKYAKKSVQSTVTIKTTIKAGDMVKYYGNNEKYSATLYDCNGKVLKKVKINYQLGNTVKSITTSKKGLVNIAITYKPGSYWIGFQNTKTGEVVYKQITIKSTIEKNNFVMDNEGNGEYSVRILNKNGNLYPNQQVQFIIGSESFTEHTLGNGIATLKYAFKTGQYTIISQYNGQTVYDTLDVNIPEKEAEKEVVKKTEFSHIISLPAYVNVTNDYVFHNSEYVLKNGTNGIIKMPKNIMFTVQILNKAQLFASTDIPGYDVHIIGPMSYLIPFDGSKIKSAYKKDKLQGEGILLSKNGDNIEIEYRSTTQSNADMFGLYVSPFRGNSETISYIQNNHEMALVNFFTDSYDENGVRINIARLYGRLYQEFQYKTYEEMTRGNLNSIRYAKTGEPVGFDYFNKYIYGNPSREDITTRFIVNGIEELEKTETISYGQNEKYQSNAGFEFLQSYAIINKEITTNSIDYWLNQNSTFISLKSVTNLYGMFMTALETAWIADEIANKYSQELDVSWSRDKTLTVMGGINLDDTYIHILNADMGMDVNGNEENIIRFRFINSINLPNIEDYVLSTISNQYHDNTTNSADNIFSAISNKTFSMAQLGEILYVFSEDESNSSIAFNTSSGIANVLIKHGNSIYKGSVVNTVDDCCTLCSLTSFILNQLSYLKNRFIQDLGLFKNIIDDLHPWLILAYKSFGFVVGKEIYVLTKSAALTFGLVTTMFFIQDIGTYYRDHMVDEKYWHDLMDSITFTRPGYLQSKKVYNIPNKKGGYDYIEIPIKDNHKLDMEKAVYISDGQVKNLSKEETYNYIGTDDWSPIAVPTKYWDKSFKGLV